MAGALIAGSAGLLTTAACSGAPQTPTEAALSAGVTHQFLERQSGVVLEDNRGGLKLTFHPEPASDSSENVGFRMSVGRTNPISNAPVPTLKIESASGPCSAKGEVSGLAPGFFKSVQIMPRSERGAGKGHVILSVNATVKTLNEENQNVFVPASFRYQLDVMKVESSDTMLPRCVPLSGTVRDVSSNDAHAQTINPGTHPRADLDVGAISH